MQYGSAGVHVMHMTDHGNSSPHDHVFLEIVLIESGTADHLDAGGTRRLRPGDVIILRPQVWHSYANARRLELFNCLIDASVLRQFSGPLARMSGAFELLKKPVRQSHLMPPAVLHASPAVRVTMRQRLDSIMNESRDKRYGWEAAMLAGVLDFLVTVARVAASTAAVSKPANDELGSRTDAAVLTVVEHIESHLAEPLSLSQMARIVHLSPPHLSRSFKRKMAMGMVEYLHRLRAEEACRLLQCTNLPVHQIAATVGFDEIAYFSRRFRSFVSLSPRAYRKKWHDR
jgi:AraC family L-rhamnose operon transcriptional activator RhaR